ncbi:M18 family aminopeptidase [Mangrovactinospora gilvigrisea]|uniref:Probable M18 family aminopeptidase 2 n=2 Tax=Mangrovactinospora gilvigrisea TaxID=1428644 RepID=A0A1J7BHP0_9ACTN|nr:M18 family aminopeptidase [Mangrovactinospora gilvigrisea]
MSHFDRAHTADLMAFTGASPTPYHAAASAAARLEAAGFARVEETDPFPAEPGGRYLVRGGTLVAWYLPQAAAGDPAAPFRIVGAHTDSPTLRVKPQPDFAAHGWRQLAVEIYGGPLLNSWLDRDLGLAGRIALRDGSVHLVDFHRPLLRVPQLAIHLDRGVNDNGLKLDKQRGMQPIWGLTGASDERGLLDFLAAEAPELRASGATAADILGWDLSLYDLQPPAFLGQSEEFFASGRLDNQLSTHAGTAALAAAATAPGADALTHIPVLVAFDHEENGSQSDTGAHGPLLGTVLERSVHARGGSVEDRARALAASVCLSSDTGHAVHPNYAERHDPTHHPMPNGGPILKVNVNQRYATDGVGRTVFAAACERAGVPYQTFVSNNAMPCGTTIGPITAARHGIATVDIGTAILSMHSVRELSGSDDPHLLASALKSFLDG